MSDKTKNVITNIIGLIFFGISVYFMFQEKPIKYILLPVGIGSYLFYYKIKESKIWIDRFYKILIDKFSGKKLN